MDDLFNRVNRRRRGQGGFTLIELLVVIAILTILAAIVLFNIVGVTNKGSTAACNTDVGTVQTAVDAYINAQPNQGLGALTTGDMTKGDLATLQSAGFLHSSSTSCHTSMSLAGNGASGYTVSGTP